MNQRQDSRWYRELVLWTEVLSRSADHKIARIDELLPWCYAATAA
jgi:hypothetical protein